MEETKKWLACNRCSSHAKEGKNSGDTCGRLLNEDWKGIVCGGKIVQCEVYTDFILEGRKSFSREMVFALLIGYAAHILKIAEPAVHANLSEDVIETLQTSMVKEWFEKQFPPFMLGGIS